MALFIIMVTDSMAYYLFKHFPPKIQNKTIQHMPT